MSDPQTQLRQAIQLAKAGDKTQARQIAQRLVDGNPEYADAWIVMAQLAEDDQQAMVCWNQVLLLRPDDVKAQEHLQRLQARDLASGSISKESPRTGKKVSKSLSRDMRVLLVTGAVILCCGLIVFIGSLSSKSQLGAQPQAILASETEIRPPKLQEPETVDITDPYETGIPQALLSKLQSSVASQGYVAFYEAEVNPQRHLIVFVDIEILNAGDRVTALDLIESSLRAYAAVDNNSWGSFSVGVFWTRDSTRCADNAGIGYSIMAKIDWQSATQADIFRTIDRLNFADEAGSNYGEMAYAPDLSGIDICNK